MADMISENTYYKTAQICGAIAIVADIPVLVLFGFGYADACVFLAAALAIAAGTKDNKGLLIGAMVMAILSMLLFLMLLFATVVVGAVVCTISDPICVAEHNARTGVTLAEDKEGDATCCGGCGMTVADAAACTAAGCQPMIPHTTYSVVYDGSTPIGTEATLWYQDGGCYAGTVTKTYDTAACSANAAAIAATPNPTIASPQTVLEPCDQETVDASTDFSGANTGCKSDLEDSTDTWCAYIGLAGFCCFLELVLMFCIAVPACCVACCGKDGDGDGGDDGEKDDDDSG